MVFCEAVPRTSHSIQTAARHAPNAPLRGTRGHNYPVAKPSSSWAGEGMAFAVTGFGSTTRGDLLGRCAGRSMMSPV
jgi:hypothetical protein